MYCNNLSRRLGSRQIFSKLTVTDPLIESILFSRLLANLQVLVGKYGATIQNRLMGTPRSTGQGENGGKKGGSTVATCHERESGTHLRGLFADGGMEYRATERAPAAGGGSSFGAGVESSQ